MKTKLLSVFFLFFFCLSFHAVSQQTGKKLNGTVIYYDSSNRTSNAPQEAFDSKKDTYFQSDAAYNARMNNWIGLDLGSKHIITTIKFAPRMDDPRYEDRLPLGLFEGANNPDFGDAIPFYIIPGNTPCQLNVIPIDCSKGFRYVRFIFPTSQNGLSSYMSELEFYGYEGEGDNKKLPQLTNIPTISIHTVNTQDITSKDYYIKGIITVIYANGTKMQTDSLEIRGRGNNSWSHPKKPYRLKLANSTRLMDLPAKGRNWTLINNYGDKTLMRNMLAFDFSKRLEMPYTSPAEGVDVVVNGDYKGCYQLCDHIDVRKNRVDIEEMTPDDLTGGYMIEIDAYADQELKRFTSNRYGIPVTIKYPGDDEITPAQENYIASHFNKLTDAVNGSQYTHPENGFRKYMNPETFLRHFLVGEYAGNTDTYWSVRMTKKKDEDQFNFGPSWDFDLGFENDWRTYPINDKTDWVCFYTGGNVNGSWQSGSSAAGGTRDFIRRIFSDNSIQQRLREIYSYYRDRNIISKEVLQNKVDEYADYLNASQQLNFKRWPIMNQKVHENPVIYGSYEGEVANVRNYIGNRIDWMDNKLNYVPTPRITVRFNKPASWSDVNIFAWIPETTDNIFGMSDPGPFMKDEGDGWYSYTFEPGVKNISLYFSDNGNMRTVDITEINEDICYGTTGQFDTACNYMIAPIDCETGRSIDVEPVIVRFNKPASWQNVNIQAWIPDVDDNILDEEWPGTRMEEEENGWYSYTFKRTERNISVSFNDDKNGRTIEMNGINESICFGTTGNLNTLCHYVIASIDCETGVSIDATPVIVRFNKPASWTGVNIQAWIPGVTDNLFEQGTPGVPMSEEGDEWYSYTFKPAERNISVSFYDDTDKMSSHKAGINTSVCIGTNGRWVDDKYGIAFTDCEAGRSVEPPTGTDSPLLAAVNVWTQRDMLYITDIKNPVTIKITDITGRNIISRQVVSGDTSVRLQQGMYVVTVEDEHMQSKTVKCIIKGL